MVSNNRPSLISTQRRLFVEGAWRRFGHWSGPLKPRVVVWPRRKPFSRAESPPIALISELKEQVRIGAIAAGEGKFSISDRAKATHGIQLPTQHHQDSKYYRFLAAKWRLKGAALRMLQGGAGNACKGRKARSRCDKLEQ